jgi:hypothetical protein
MFDVVQSAEIDSPPCGCPLDVVGSWWIPADETSLQGARCEKCNEEPKRRAGQRARYQVRAASLASGASERAVWSRCCSGMATMIRQLKDMKGTIDIDDMDPQTIVDFAELCGMPLANAHARSGDFCQIAGYLGKGERFDISLAEFADADADQVEQDHALFERAVRAGRLPIEHAA